MQPEQNDPTSKPVGQPALQNASACPQLLLMFKEPNNFLLCYLKPSVATEVSERQQESTATEEKKQSNGFCPLIPCAEHFWQ